MCFSATASFVTAAVTGGIGVVTLSRAEEPRELPLAATPLLFAIQQTIEGLLWLDLPVAPGGSLSITLTSLFLFFAQVFWPVFSPAAVVLIEPNEKRRRLMIICLAVGVSVGGYFLWSILTLPHGAVILDCHIVYVTEDRRSDATAGVAYLTATSLPLLLSSRRTVIALGVVILVGSAATYVSYWAAFVSVWCFFAAAASVLILGHFAWWRRQRPRAAV